MLTNAAVKAARPRAAAYKIFDERGLHLLVAPNGRKSLRMRFRLEGHEQLMTFGMWPEVSLLDARASCAAAHELLERGEDPRRRPAAAAVQICTFEEAARAWHAFRRPQWTAVHAGDVLANLERDIIPAIGAMPLSAITSPVILAVLRSIEGRGSIETARRVRQRISNIFALAVSEGWGGVEADPAAIVGKALAATPLKRKQPALTDIHDARALLTAADLVDAAPVIKLASKFLALTAVRLAAVRGAAWSEFEGIDWEGDFVGPLQPVWRIPAARMKLTAAKKTDSDNDHLVTLSREAVDVLRAARLLGGAAETRSAFVFPGRGGRYQLGEAAIGDLYARAGFGARHVPHGWRATFSTLMNLARPEDRAVIDQALGHAMKSEDGRTSAKVEAAYNRAQHLARRRWLFQRWAELLCRPCK